MEALRKLNLFVASSAGAPFVASVLAIVARALMAYIFIVSGYGKIAGYDATVQYMESAGVSGSLLPLVIALEIGGGVALLVGFQTRLAALALAIFSVIAALIFHTAADPGQQINFMKNLAMAGGLLGFFLNGAGRWSLDAEHSQS